VTEDDSDDHRVGYSGWPCRGTSSTRASTSYTHVSDQHTTYGTQIIVSTERDATYTLDGLQWASHGTGPTAPESARSTDPFRRSDRRHWRLGIYWASNARIAPDRSATVIIGRQPTKPLLSVGAET
jgi:hypothetical protein